MALVENKAQRVYQMLAETQANESTLNQEGEELALLLIKMNDDEFEELYQSYELLGVLLEASRKARLLNVIFGGLDA